MLLNEFLKEHRKVQEFEANAVKHQKQIEALTTGLQKVSAQLFFLKFRRRCYPRVFESNSGVTFLVRQAHRPCAIPQA
jgi:hypothetical protein